MATVLWCWRCQMEVPMLDEQEWQRIPSLNNARADIRRYRVEHPGVSPGEAYSRLVLDAYFKVTGVHETNHNAVWHHRVSLFGPPCAACGKPLRTPRAAHCAECGAPREDGGSS